MAEPVVEAAGMSRRYGSLRALVDLDFELRAGESLAIFGPNGSGKTTLVKLLAMLLRPTEGRLRIFGEDQPRAALRRRIGLVSHGSFLYGELTAGENLRFYAALYGLADAEARVAAMLAEVEVEDWRDRPVKSFSRGMEQRVALARAFLHDPDLLLLDEPYSGLDPRAGDHLQQILQRFHLRGKTIVLTTHDIGRGLEVCDRAAILRGGRMVWQSGRFVPGLQEMARIYERQASAS